MCATLLHAPVAAQAATSMSESELREQLRAVPHQILYETYVKDNWELFIMNADGGDKRNLTHTKNIHELYPQASPDGSKICFLADVERDGETIRGVHYMNADGTGRTLVAEKARQPCWSPDGTRIAFVKQEFPRFNVTDYVSKRLYFYDIRTGKITEHPNRKIHHLYNPSWSANGEWILSTVHGGMGYGHAIIAIEVNGMGVYDLKITGCRPCISNDGRMLTWSPDDHTINVGELDYSGTSPRVVHIRAIDHHERMHLYHPDFSPDGLYVTYSVGPGGRILRDGPGTHTAVAEMVGVRGPWNIYLKRVDGAGPAIALTKDASLCSKESEWIYVSRKAASR